MTPDTGDSQHDARVASKTYTVDCNRKKLSDSVFLIPHRSVLD
jgi:hypothetical protein